MFRGKGKEKRPLPKIGRGRDFAVPPLFAAPSRGTASVCLSTHRALTGAPGKIYCGRRAARGPVQSAAPGCIRRALRSPFHRGTHKSACQTGVLLAGDRAGTRSPRRISMSVIIADFSADVKYIYSLAKRSISRALASAISVSLSPEIMRANSWTRPASSSGSISV